MGRPREFDEEQALSGAMRVFWQKGYDAASIPDLLAATGLSRSSLYETFGDKQSLFEASALAYFREYGARRVAALREAKTAREGLRNFFSVLIECCLDRSTPSGCLMTNAATSLDSHDPRIAKMVADGIGGMGRELLTLLKRAQAAGEIAADKDIQALSHMLLGVTLGITVVARVTPVRGALQAMADSAIEAMGVRENI